MIGRKIDIHIDRQIDRYINMHMTDRQIGGWAHRQINGHTDKDRQIDRQI